MNTLFTRICIENRNPILIIWLLMISQSCNTTNILVGKYKNEFGDKVRVKKNMTYILKEKLDGSTRITTGIWQEWIKEGVQKIQFLNIPGYKIENNSTLKIENSNEQFSNVKIFYKDTDSIILLPYAYGFFQKDTIGLMGLHSNDFKNFTFSEKLDSLFLGMVKYKNVTIKIPDTLKHSYILRFYPTETISNFDRVYNITGGNFKPLDTTNRDKRLRFKKSGV